MFPKIQSIWHGDRRVGQLNMWWPHYLIVEYRIFPNFEIVRLVDVHHCTKANLHRAHQRERERRTKKQPKQATNQYPKERLVLQKKEKKKKKSCTFNMMFHYSIIHLIDHYIFGQEKTTR